MNSDHWSRRASTPGVVCRKSRPIPASAGEGRPPGLPSQKSRWLTCRSRRGPLTSPPLKPRSAVPPSLVRQARLSLLTALRLTHRYYSATSVKSGAAFVQPTDKHNTRSTGSPRGTHMAAGPLGLIVAASVRQLLGLQEGLEHSAGGEIASPCSTASRRYGKRKMSGCAPPRRGKPKKAGETDDNRNGESDSGPKPARGSGLTHERTRTWIPPR